MPRRHVLRRRPRPGRVLACSLAAVVAWSRVYHDAHWASDSVAGAVLGVMAGRTTVRRLRDRQDGDAGEPRAAGARIIIPVARVAF